MVALELGPLAYRGYERESTNGTVFLRVLTVLFVVFAAIAYPRR